MKKTEVDNNRRNEVFYILIFFPEKCNCCFWNFPEIGKFAENFQISRH